jgi:hypothetical protein
MKLTVFDFVKRLLITYLVAWVSTQLFLIIKTMSYGSTKRPLLLERAGVMRIKSSSYIPLIPTFSLWRRSNRTCVDIYDLVVRCRSSYSCMGPVLGCRYFKEEIKYV